MPNLSFKSLDLLPVKLRSSAQSAYNDVISDAESVAVPDQFAVTYSPDFPAVLITDTKKNRTITMGLCGYKEVRRFLADMYGK